MNRLLLVFLLLLGTVPVGMARSVVPPTYLVQDYTVDDYEASCQNWDVSVSYWGTLFVANNSGLLTFDGNTWHCYPLPDGAAVRQVAFQGDTIYTRSDTGMGYWLYNTFGGLDYQDIESLPPHINMKKEQPRFPIPESILRFKPTAIAAAGPYRFVGTERAGLFILDEAGETLLHLTEEGSLPDNIVRAICVQDAALVWVAFDNGLAQIDLNPPLTMLGRRGEVGKLLDAAGTDEHIYIHTNLGYFCRPWLAGTYFKPIPAEKGEAILKAQPEPEPVKVDQVFENVKSLGDFAWAEDIYVANDDRYWLLVGNQAGLVEGDGRGQGRIKCRVLFDNYRMHLASREKRVISLNDSLCIVSAMEGPLLVNMRALIASSLGGLTMPSFNRMEYRDAAGNLCHLRPDTNAISLPHRFQMLTVDVGTTVFTPNHFISYKLEGVSEEWSAWQSDGQISFLQLPVGQYELHVRKYVVKGPFPEITLRIEVRPAWYNTLWAYIIYILLLGMAAQVLQHTIQRRRQRQVSAVEEEERKAEELRIQQMKQELLESELQNKNNELTLQTSALVRRNQAIQTFLDELERQKETLGDRYPNKLYNKLHALMESALNDQADWQLFEGYFNNAHHQFLDRLRQQYGDLTTGDLRICCLLRMNLSTKEIASLMNVSVRAIELRRYRLRKRLALEGDTNLVDFLMKY